MLTPRRAVWGVSLVLTLCTFASHAQAQTGGVQARLSADTVEEGSTFTYSVTAATQGRADIDMTKAPDFGTLAVVGQQQIPQYITINGQTQRRLTLSYSLRARSTGTFEIAGPVLQIGDEAAQANSVSLKVVPRGKAPRPTTDRSSGYFIETTLQPSSRDPWVGEQVLLSYDLYADATQLDTVARQMDEPPLDDFWIEDLSERTAGGSQISSVDGRLMERKSMRTYALFPLHAGEITIEPMEIELVIGNLFRRGREVRIASKAIELDVRALPPDAPASFYEGNVGNWTFRVTSDQSATRVGRSVRVELAVSGDGQLGRLEVPTLPEIEGVRLSEPETESQPAVRNLVVGGTKKNIYNLTPLREGTITIPPVEFSHFDPGTGRYVTSKSEPIELRVASGHLPPAPVAESDIARRTLAGGEDMVAALRAELASPRLTMSLARSGDGVSFGWWWWLLGGVSLAAFLGIFALPWVRGLVQRGAPERARRAQREAALARLEAAGDDPEAITAAIREFLHEIYDVPRGVVTASDIRRGFARQSLPEDVASELAEVLETCEQARFSPGARAPSGLAARAQKALVGLGPVDSAKSASVAVVLLVCAAATVGGATEVGASEDLPARALTALEAGDWAGALPPLQQLATAHPYSVDVLYDLGTTAAHAEDYGVARWALERAAWLAPHDDDIAHNRDVVARIVRLKAIEVSRTGRTMDGDEALFWWRVASSIPPWVYGLGMCLGWLFAAALLVLRRRDERPAFRDAAFVGMIVAVCIGCFATFAASARASLVESAEPVVVTGPLELREGPNPAAALKRVPASMVPGTLLRITDRRGDWVKVAWPGDTAWAKSEGLRPIR